MQGVRLRRMPTPQRCKPHEFARSPAARPPWQVAVPTYASGSRQYCSETPDLGSTRVAKALVTVKAAEHEPRVARPAEQHPCEALAYAPKPASSTPMSALASRPPRSA